MNPAPPPPSVVIVPSQQTPILLFDLLEKAERECSHFDFSVSGSSSFGRNGGGPVFQFHQPGIFEGANCRIKLKKSPVALERLKILTDFPEPRVRYYKDRNNPHIYREFTPLEFLAELQQHIPDKWEQTTRYYGELSARTRGAEKKRLRWLKLLISNSDHQEPTEETRPASANWARLIKQVYEIDPLRCPRCGENMKIVAFVQDSREITKICESLGIQPWRAPPPLPKKQLDIEFD